MSIVPTANIEQVTVEDVRVYGLDLIVSLSNGTEARHSYPDACIEGMVERCCAETGVWTLSDDESVLECTTDELLEYVNWHELYFRLGYMAKFNFEYQERNVNKPWANWARKHYVYAYSQAGAYRLLHRHKPGATNVNCVSTIWHKK